MTKRNLNAVSVGWGRRVWHNGERSHEGFGFEVTRRGLGRSVSGSLTQGTMYYKVTAEEAVALLRQIREKVLSQSGEAHVYYSWGTVEEGARELTQRECVWRLGQYSSSIRHNPEPATGDLRSPVAQMFVEYLETGSEDVLTILHDYLTDHLEKATTA